MMYAQPHGTVGYGGGEPHKTMQNTALSEKQEMLSLNDRLSGLLQQLREADAEHGKPYREATRILEAEIEKLKKMYEAEIKKLSNTIDNLNREKAGHLANIQKQKSLIDEFQKRVELESGNAARLASELEAQTQRSAQKDREITELKGSVDKHKAELARLQPDHARLAAENGQLRNKLESETKERMGKDEAAKQLNDQLVFQKNRHNQEEGDMAARLKAANDIIKSLESKLKQYIDGASLTQTLDKLRECTASELARYQAESEAALNKALAELRHKVDSSGNTEALRQEKAQLEEEIQKMTAKIADLEAKLQAAEKQRRGLEDALHMQRANAQKAISDLERRLQELQRTLVDNLKEYNTARDMQVSLQTEIDAYRKLMDTENDRLARPTSTTAMSPRPMTSKKAPSYSTSNKIPPYTPNKAGGMKDSSKSALPRIGPPSIYNPYNTIYRSEYVHPNRRFAQSDSFMGSKDMKQSVNTGLAGTGMSYGAAPTQAYMYSC